MGALIEPPLTTIGQPIRKMGQAAAELLIEKIDHPEVNREIVFDGKLIVRGTT